ncbi:hypothetical protein [Spirochaeta africana]|uniref:Coiled coil domain-containing protein n=1 Tax=Spirochaeta africana (strain ATCC 700263 / DSM 8902 / Z-7692) TaxID=889378 RepID=H9UFB9_SPIAZ|nr:hypothetical protein [Spirochaeta africana]AFG36212.1 hypothetical protein Spiaf_0103 [Spirochaeta africana DSM 8902]
MATREEFIQKLKTKLDDWNANIDELEAQLHKVEEGSREKLQTQIQELKKKRDEARSDLHRVQSASAEAFEDMRDGLELAWDSVSEAFRSALHRFLD